MSGGAAPTGLVARWALHVALIAALGAFVVARSDRSVLVLLIPLALVPALRWRRAPRLLVSLLPVTAQAALVATFALAVLSRQLLFIREDLGFRYGGILGWCLAVLAVAFLLGHRIWPATSTLLPAIVGLLVVSGLNPGVGLFPYFAVASALALWTFALVRGGPRRLGGPLLAFLLVAAAVSAATLRFLPWAQPFVERAVARTFAEGTTGLSGESRLGEFGDLATSDRIVLRVWTSRPRPLRAYVFSRFDGVEWSTADRRETSGNKPVLPALEAGDETRLPDVPGNLFVLATGGDRAREDPAGLVETRILQSAVTDWPLLVPAEPRLVRAPTPYLLRSREGELRWPPYEPARVYSVGAEREPGTRPARGEGASLRAAALGLPARLDPRIRLLAGTLATDAGSDRGRLDNTVEWLHTHLTYSLEVGEFETADPLAEFLFDKKKGYCEYFASAAAVLLRLQGVPTRYVKGFGVGPQNFVPGGYGVSDHYLIRESDAHAWVESYIEGAGWVEADPTPPDGFAAVHAWAPGPLERLVEAIRVHRAELWALLTHEGFGGLLTLVTASAGRLAGTLWRHPGLVVCGVALLLAALSRDWLGALLARLRSRRRARLERQAALPGPLASLLAAVERHWARQGRARPPASGLQEHLGSLPAGALSRSTREASAAVVAACYRSAYGGAPPTPSEITLLQRAVAHLD